MLGQIALINEVIYHTSEYLSPKIRHIRNKKRGEEEEVTKLEIVYFFFLQLIDINLEKIATMCYVY